MAKKIWVNICEYPWISGLIGVGFIVIVAIFTTYALSLGPRSHDHTAWSSFGSMLAGVFTFFGSTATIATLLFLNAQFKEQQKVTAKQIEAVTFEQYVNHRKLFFERLKEIEESLDNAIKFKNHDKLYHNLFPHNSPLECSFRVKIISGGLAKAGDLSDMYSSFVRLRTLLGNQSWISADADNLVKHLIIMPNSLSFIHVEKDFEGDLALDGKNLGINIYSLDEYINRVTVVLNAFLVFTGNPPVDSINHLSESAELRKALILNFEAQFSPKHSLVPIRKYPLVYSLERLHHWVDQAKNAAGQRIFVDAWQTMNTILSSKFHVNSLSDKAKQISMIKEFMLESDRVYKNSLPNTHERNLVYEYKGKLDLILPGLQS